MLYVTITTKDAEQMTSTLHALDFTYYDGSYRLSNKRYGDIDVHHSADKYTFSFPDSEGFLKYLAIHQLLVQILQEVEGTFDDTAAFMGYLENGEPSYILTNWQAWVDFLQGAKHVSMTGMRVKVFNDKYIPLEEGVLLEYSVTNNPFNVTSCTLLTEQGEKKLNGEHYIIEATSQFF